MDCKPVLSLGNKAYVLYPCYGNVRDLGSLTVIASEAPTASPLHRTVARPRPKDGSNAHRLSVFPHFTSLFPLSLLARPLPTWLPDARGTPNFAGFLPLPSKGALNDSETEHPHGEVCHKFLPRFSYCMAPCSPVGFSSSPPPRKELKKM